MLDSGRLQVNTLGSEGMAIGLVPPVIFDTVIIDTTAAFTPQDIFLLYTDGVTEAINAEGAEFSSARLSDSLKYLRQHTPKEINQGILASVTSFTADSASLDDITLVAVRHT